MQGETERRDGVGIISPVAAHPEAPRAWFELAHGQGGFNGRAQERFMAGELPPSENSGASEQRRLFISYMRDTEPDGEVATFLSNGLAAQGFTVFIDFKIDMGTNWADLITREISACDFFIVLLTEQATKPPSVVLAETLLAAETAAHEARPKILPVRVAFPGRLPLDLRAAIDRLQYFEWHDPADNDRLLAALLRAMGAPGAAPSRLLKGDHFIITESLWQSPCVRESLASTTIVPVTANEEALLAVTRPTRTGQFTARVSPHGDLEVAIWAGAKYRAVASLPREFVKVREDDSHSWCFARHLPDEPIALKRPDGRRDPIIVTCDQTVVKATWTIMHQRGATRERFLVVMK